MNASLKPLVACATTEGLFSNRIEAAAEKIGSDFFTSVDLGQTLKECEQRESSCVVVDYEITLDPAVGSLTTRRVAENRVLLVAVPHGDIKAAFQAATVGAVGVLEKPVSEKELIFTLETAFASESEMEKRFGGQQRFANQTFSNLTDREKEVLALLMNGEPNKRVASKLDIGLRTVEADRAQVMKKLKVRSFVELIRLVAEIEKDIINARQKIFNDIVFRSSEDPGSTG